jgi:hypothetical protein
MPGKKPKKSAKVTSKMAASKRCATKPVLLAGGNPQIPKADGDAPVRAYIAAMPGWKREIGRRLDAAHRAECAPRPESRLEHPEEASAWLSRNHPPQEIAGAPSAVLLDQEGDLQVRPVFRD